MPLHIINMTESNADEILSQNARVVIDFWANSCGPCKQLAAVLEALQASDDFDAEVVVAKVRIDTEFALAKRYKVRSSPTLIRFESGQEAARKNSGWDASSVKAFLTE